MRMLAGLIFLAMSGATLAQLGPSAGSNQRDGSQPAGTALQPDQRVQTPQQTTSQTPLQTPPQNTLPSGGAVGEPIQETGNYGNLGLSDRSKPGDATPRSLVQPDYRKTGEENPFQKQ